MRCLGDVCLPPFKTVAERLVVSKLEGEQRFAAEILTGIVRGKNNILTFHSICYRQ
jgi:hypothetical protein